MNAHAELETEEATVRSAARILVVDDTPANVKLLEDLLGFHGYEVEAATSGEEALEAIRERLPDLMLLDVLMPGLSGYDVCRAVRKDPSLAMLPVVLVTALEDREERVKGLDAGADDFLSKPVNPPELLARVRSLLRIKHLYDTVQKQAHQLAAWNQTLEARVVDMIHDQASHREIDRIDDAQTRHAQVMPLQFTQQFVQLPHAVFHEHTELMQARPFLPSHGLGFQMVIVVIEFGWHPFHS